MDEKAGRVRVEVYPPLSGFVPGDGPGCRVLEEEIGSAAQTVGDLLLEVACRHEALGRAVLDAATGRLRPHVLLALNGHVLPASSGLQTALHDGDRVSLLPAYGGGGVRQ